VGFAASGRIHTVAGSASEGFVPLVLSAPTCARLTIETAELSKVFVKSSDSPTVYVAEQGAYRAVGSWNELMSLSDGQPTILVVAGETLASLPRTSG
jgi:hypothetical protein